MTMLRIDTHHHLWQYSAADYSWISPEMGVLRRNFTPADLQPEMERAGIKYSVAVQASQTLDHTRFLLNAAKQYPFIKGVVGWVPLADADVEMDLEHFASDRTLCGIRHVLHDETDDYYMLRADFNRGIRTLERFDLAYDILIFEHHLLQTIHFVDKHPAQTFVVDHLAKPRVRDDSISPWCERMCELAKRPNVYCKLSGLATEGDHTRWTQAQLSRYIEVVLRAFEPRRVMFGSDWPVCLLAITYSQWATLVSEEIAKLSVTEQARIWFGTAAEAYRLSV
jgi:L-fuconolactonase